jgi:hypothetical protein
MCDWWVTHSAPWELKPSSHVYPHMKWEGEHELWLTSWYRSMKKRVKVKNSGKSIKDWVTHAVILIDEETSEGEEFWEEYTRLNHTRHPNHKHSQVSSKDSWIVPVGISQATTLRVVLLIWVIVLPGATTLIVILLWEDFWALTWVPVEAIFHKLTGEIEHDNLRRSLKTIPQNGEGIIAAFRPRNDVECIADAVWANKREKPPCHEIEGSEIYHPRVCMCVIVPFRFGF